jgi:hypothetical protein
MHVFIYTSDSGQDPNRKALELNRAQHDRPAADVITQQYSSVTLISVRFLCRKENLVRNLTRLLLNF